MSAADSVEAVEVFLWGVRVGAAALDPQTRYVAFEFDPRWARRGIPIAPLALPNNPTGRVHVYTELAEPTFRRLPAFLADALPDSWGNALIDRYLSLRGRDRASITALDRLAYMGKRALGALEFKPVLGPRRRAPVAIEMQQLVEQSRMALRGQLQDPDAASDSLQQLIDVGTSAGGARPKAVIALNPTTGELRSGQFDAPDGFEHHLLKFDLADLQQPAETRSLTRIEYAYHRMATTAGIEMMPCRLIEEGGRAHFLTRRFDRMGNRKVHAQTLCALAHLDYKYVGAHSYEQVFDTIAALGLDEAARVQMFRRAVFNVAVRNQDDHTKNIAFLLHEGATAWELAPAYDLTFACNPASKWNAQQFLAVNGKYRDIAFADFIALARRVGVPGAHSILRDVTDVVANWPEFADSAGVTPEHRQAIGRLQLEALAQLSA